MPIFVKHSNNIVLVGRLEGEVIFTDGAEKCQKHLMISSSWNKFMPILTIRHCNADTITKMTCDIALIPGLSRYDVSFLIQVASFLLCIPYPLSMSRKNISLISLQRIQLHSMSFITRHW